ncbi:hypothetical protein K474DRAFT_1588514 [Panus rudis PR-1116 ss-1]|nr:hypothetical protein K474DRAFT_1588514 [Panus rudis PR-1116 ss-1]
MLDLPNVRSLLTQVLSLPSLHTAALFTPEGHLVSWVADPSKTKDDVRVLVGLSSEIWQETKDQGVGMVDSELGRVLVLPTEDAPSKDKNKKEKEGEPLLLLVLNADQSVSWADLETKGRLVVEHLEKPVAELHAKLAVAPTSPILQRSERAHR